MKIALSITRFAFGLAITVPAIHAAAGNELIAQEGTILRSASSQGERRLPEPAAKAPWCEGRILLRDGSPTPAGMRVTGRGALWPDGSDLREAQVAPDGSFRIPMAPGTRLGAIHLEADGYRLAAPGIWMPWFKEPIHLTPYSPMRLRLQVIDGDKSPRGEIWVRRVTRSRFGSLADLALTPEQDGTYLDRPARFYNVSYLMGAGGRATARVQGPKENKDRAGRLQVTLFEPARISGRVSVPKLGESQRLWLRCAQPFQSLIGDPEVALEADGSFDLSVPAGVDLWLDAGTKGLWGDRLKLGTLLPGEHCGGLRITLRPQSGLEGRVVDRDGRPVAGAHVQSLVLLPSESGSPRDPGMGPMHQTITDSSGNFSLLGLDQFESVPLEVTLSPSPDFRLGGSVVWQADQVSQHYEAVAVGKQRSELVFDASGSRLWGRVLDADGQAIPEFTIRLTAKGHHAVSVPEDSPSCTVVLESSPLISPEQGLADHFTFLNERRYLVSDPLGRFDLVGVPAGAWEMAIEVNGVATLDGTHVSMPLQAPLTLRIPQTSDVLVSVQDDLGKTWPGCRLRLYRYDAGEAENNLIKKIVWGTRKLEVDRTGLTGAKGSVLFGDLPEGDYCLLSQGVEGRLLSSKKFLLKSGEHLEVKLAAPLLGSIRGQFHWKGASGPMTIRLKQDGRFVYSNPIEYRAGFLFAGVAPGRYQVHYRSISGPDGIEERIWPVEVQVLPQETTRVVIDR
ncbi:MAG: carboxypeptidase regulatory-like domain-containing protein [bacterium]|nr:carboxypeptidase regulatory-like domain-containing protein [bacterium]